VARTTTASTYIEPERPTLHLSGPKLRASLENLIHAAEMAGGVEQYAAAIRLKSEAFQEQLADAKVATVGLGEFTYLTTLMATVRRRIGRVLDTGGWHQLRDAMTELLRDAHVPGTADARIARFCKSFPEDRDYRFMRDLAGELLHNVYPEHYPLMQRWVWDAKQNTGVLREIWHDETAGDNVDHVVIKVPDTHEAFLVLREELAGFVADNGVFRDVLWYVDLLTAQIYGDYINAQGGAYLKTDFTAGPDLLEQSRRILGLDRINRITSDATKTIDGNGHDIQAVKRLS
jgi:hypothetical protein